MEEQNLQNIVAPDLQQITSQPQEQVTPSVTDTEKQNPSMESSQSENIQNTPEWLTKAKAAAEEEKRALEIKLDKIQSFLESLQDPEMHSFIEKVFNNAKNNDGGTKWVNTTLGQPNPTIATEQEANIKKELPSISLNTQSQQQSA